MEFEQTVDYVIIGGGSAGCVLAARLSEDPKTSVVLLEAGGEDNHPLIRLKNIFHVFQLVRIRYEFSVSFI